ncbi:MAG: hypothetical protein HY608_10660, partial [Planctomycetes bacterium]|nr:hypothetical protein [Planctomycetota bacterium]
AAAALLGLGVRRRIGWCLHLCVLLFTLSAIVLLHLTVTEYGWTRLLRLVLALWAQFLLFRAITSVQVLRNNP